MIRTLTSGIALLLALNTAAIAETYEVQMMNRGEAGSMVFEPGFLRIALGDTVRFVATDRSHNAETIPEMTPEGGTSFEGRINEEVEVIFETDGVYGIRCKPHYALGMVMVIAVGDVSAAPADFLEGRIPRSAMTRFTDQLSNL